MNKIAIITGASSGLGSEIAFQISKLNYHVVIIGRNEKGLYNTSLKILNKNKECTIIKADVNDENFVNVINRGVAKINGNIELIINNAGIGIFDKLEDIKIEDWHRQININLTSCFLLVQEFIKDMKKKKKGTLLFINSVAGKKAYPFSSAYVASKFALRGFADSIREELREFGIKVMSVFPGAIDTPFWNNVNAEYPRDEMMTSEEVAISIVQTLENNGVGVVEEMVIRRYKGDF
tara:strand:+ start:1655 stop:2362 length:708 start_codon:yes stop_codon:yes gene_type:complete